ncbi:MULTISPECIES: hypothetical protein [Pseudothermotoga]|nr:MULTISPECIES: hypothetical protein [Pseudothermotoga]
MERVKKLICMLMLLFLTTIMGDIIDFSGDGRYASATGPWAFRMNPAGIVENEFRQLLISNTLRMGSNNVRSFSVSLLQPSEDSLAGVLQLSSDFTDFEMGRLSFLYGIAGRASTVDLGLNIGFERIEEDSQEDYSVFIDVGARGKFSEDSYAYYSIVVKKFRVWSSKSDLMNTADIGGGVSLEFDQMKFSFDVMYVSNELWNFSPAAELSLAPVNLYVCIPLFYLPENSKSALSVDFGGDVQIGNFNIGASVFYPFTKLNSSDLFGELGYDWHIDFRVGVRW